MQTLTLRRVPPNLLVSQGATDFAYEMGIPVLPYDALVSPAARERWVRWRSDLKTAEKKARKSGNPPSSWKFKNDAPATAEDEHVRQKMREQHEKNMLQEHASQEHPMSPLPSEDPLFYAIEETSNSHPGPSAPHSEESTASWPSDECVPTPESAMSVLGPKPVVAAPGTVAESSRNAFINSTQKVPTLSKLRDHRALRDITGGDYIEEDADMKDVDHGSIHAFGQTSNREGWGDGSGEDSESASSSMTMKPAQDPPIMSLAMAVETLLPETPLEKQLESPTPRTATPLDHVKETAPFPPPTALPKEITDREDSITDTVGAIAIDSWGNIACGASSGGIGMKYRGRVGPAALVGIGAAVVPIDPDDVEKTCVATVTSGTGEHMATTMAATVCAERLYQSMKKGKAGEYHETTEDEALKAMIENEFMGWFPHDTFVWPVTNIYQVIQVLRTATRQAQLVFWASRKRSTASCCTTATILILSPWLRCILTNLVPGVLCPAVMAMVRLPKAGVCCGIARRKRRTRPVLDNDRLPWSLGNPLP
jgi:taspase (threonine aspartase 1)